MGRKWCFTLVLLLCTDLHCDCARILGIFPSPSFSHQIVFQTIMKALAARGHQVTVISTDPLKVSSDSTIVHKFLFSNVKLSRAPFFPQCVICISVGFLCCVIFMYRCFVLRYAFELPDRRGRQQSIG
jgi:hypothetical protein